MSSEYLKKPILAKRIDYRCGSGVAFTSCEMQGWRRSMEDAVVCEELAEGVHLFAVLDGHGGPEVAQYVAQLLPKEILLEPHFKLRNYPKALTNVFRRIDELLESERAEEELLAIGKRLNVSGPPGERVAYRAGTTAVVLLVTKYRLYVANIGDSRAVLSRSGAALALSNDHKPDLPSERNRIEKAGGYVKEGRVNGSLGLSRSFGDFEFKHFSERAYEEQAVTSCPEVVEMERSPDDNFVLLGCDGVWERYVSNSQKMVAHIAQLREKHGDKRIVMEKLFGDLVARDMKEKSGCDNMSAILVELF